MRRCKFCGCTEAQACPGGCRWVDRLPDTCTSCYLLALEIGLTHLGEIGMGAVRQLAEEWRAAGAAALLDNHAAGELLGPDHLVEPSAVDVRMGVILDASGRPIR